MKIFLSRDSYFFSVASPYENFENQQREIREAIMYFFLKISDLALVCAVWPSWRWWCWCHQVHFPAHLTLPSTPTESWCQYHFSFECLHLLKFKFSALILYPLTFDGDICSTLKAWKVKWSTCQVASPRTTFWHDGGMRINISSFNFWVDASFLYFSARKHFKVKRLKG